MQKQWSRDPKLLRSLQYFVVVARHGSVARAAAEIGVSASAISHQLRELSTTLGEDLVTKNGRGIALTEVGQRLAGQLSETFSGIDGIVQGVVGGQRTTLRVAVCSSFGPGWLAPRMPDFAQANPQIDLELRLYSHEPEQTHAVADALITAQPTKPGYKSIPLFDEMVVAVLAPGPGRPAAPLPRLITTDRDGPAQGDEWLTYCAASGRSPGDLEIGDFLKCTHYILALELAKAGMGMALVPDFLAAEALATGRVVQLDPGPVPSGRRYQLCYKEALADDPALRSLTQWFRAKTGGKLARYAPDGRARR